MLAYSYHINKLENTTMRMFQAAADVRPEQSSSLPNSCLSIHPKSTNLSKAYIPKVGLGNSSSIRGQASTKDLPNRRNKSSPRGFSPFKDWSVSISYKGR